MDFYVYNRAILKICLGDEENLLMDINSPIYIGIKYGLWKLRSLDLPIVPLPLDTLRMYLLLLDKCQTAFVIYLRIKMMKHGSSFVENNIFELNELLFMFLADQDILKDICIVPIPYIN